VVKRGVAAENTRLIRLTPKLTEEEVRRQASLGLFELLAEERNELGVVRAFTVRETKHYESDAAFLKADPGRARPPRQQADRGGSCR
jgi:type III restriction enzyme